MCCYLVSFQTISFPLHFRGEDQEEVPAPRVWRFFLEEMEGVGIFFKGKEPRTRLFQALDPATYPIYTLITAQGK